MNHYFIAVTYDVCEHNDLYESMNEYPLDLSADLDKQIRDIAKGDFAPLVKIYKSKTSDLKELELFKEYTFKEYECGCT
ncbi:hypothetical protein N0O92_20455 [Alkalihalobacillus sp. MEB130]|uniref:hypothetical protein n=1 Tax=Alkalihalobacillus sp. MEB130 TaxID=2976704 RepID=UPI0028DE6E97|nr:hypothetical protein [Alkalihalobacillus sp. MEB130]MDT8862575.1 hypothetical protein [Alkalihalobacillus sp. MEB130]